MYRQTLALIAVVFVAGAAHAQSDERNESRRDHQGPPEAALQACSNSLQGDPCSFAGRHGDPVEGSCEAPDDRPLACRPEGGGRPTPHNINIDDTTRQ